MIKSRISLAVLMVILSLSLSSCGVVQVENGCVLIKEQSEEKRELGTTILEMADAEKIGDGLTVEEAQAEGYKYLIEGTQLVVDNPKCFTADEVKVAKNLLGQ